MKEAEWNTPTRNINALFSTSTETAMSYQLLKAVKRQKSVT